MLKPRLFIGSSTERLAVARALQDSLQNCAEATVWDKAEEFALGKSTLDGLLKVAKTYDFALFVFGQDDCTMIRGSESKTVRDNVIFELGLLMGAMGVGRAFWLSPKGPKAPRLLTDLGGIVHLEFDEPDLSDLVAVAKSLVEAGEQIRRQITMFGFRRDPGVHDVPMRQALCLASSQYSEARFQQDIEYIHNFFPGVVTSKQGITADSFLDYFVPGCSWDIVHLGLFVDKRNQRLLFDTAPGTRKKQYLPIEAVEGRLKDCGAALVVIITCDSLKFGEHLARFTNVIAGHQAIAPAAAISWAKSFYRELSMGVSLSQAFYKAQDDADPGLILLARKDIIFRPVRKSFAAAASDSDD